MAARVPQPTNDRLCQQHGRRFSVYGLTHNVYGVPMDDPEQERRLDDLVKDVTGGQSCLVPGVPLPSPIRGSDGEIRNPPVVLDCGFGNAVWVDRLLEEENNSYIDVTGVDICLNQSTSNDDDDDEDGGEGSVDNGIQEYTQKRWNFNHPFSDDRSEDRLRPETFDVINSRFLADGINASRWEAYVGDLRKLLKKGGWVQMVELIPHIQSENGRLSDDSYLTTWWTSYSGILDRMGKKVRIGRDLERMLAREGFDRIHATAYTVPIGTWHRSRELGRDNRDMVHQMLVSLSLWPLLHHGRMPEAQYRRLIAGARRELQDDSLKLYYRLYVVYARRPPSRRR